jgi:outer membrane lipoprotein-sorting protein
MPLLACWLLAGLASAQPTKEPAVHQPTDKVREAESDPTDKVREAESDPTDKVRAASDEPALREILQKAEAFLAKQKTIHVTSNYQWESGVEGKKEKGTKKIEGWLVRPGEFRLTITPEGTASPDLLVVGDGKTAYTYLPQQEMFSASPLVGPKAGLERNVIVSQALAGSGLEMTWRPDMARFIIAQAQNILDRGFEKNRDVEGRHFSFSFGDVRVQLWFTEGEEPILKRVKRSTKLPTPAGKDPFELDIISDLAWDFAAPTDETLFKFSRTPAARRVADLYTALTGDDPAAPAKGVAEIEFTGIDNKPAKLPHGKPMILVVGLAWDDTTGSLIKQLTGEVAKLEKKEISTGGIVIGDEPADLEKYGKSLAGVSLWLDRAGTLAAMLGEDALPIVVYWDGTAIGHHAPVDEKKLGEEIKKGLNAPQK